MTPRPRLLLLGALAVALVSLTLPSTNASAADRPDPATIARRHLGADSSGGLRIVGDRSGRVAFVGTGASTEVDNPDVPRGASVAAAARAHLDRYGAVLGATGDTTYVRRSTTRAASGVDVVTYTQEVDGVPVIGGDVVVSMGSDRGLRSLQSTVSGAATVLPATVSQEQAAATARGVVARSARGRHLEVSPAGRWLLDPGVVDVSLPSGARTVWRFEVGDGAGVRQLVLVDDRTGAVLLHSDLIEHADRVVCDQGNTPGPETPCTSGFAARVEGGPASSVADVNDAYDLSGVVSDFYQQVGGVSLTQLLGVDAGGAKKLASTVRFCPDGSASPCQYDNAFWNGQQMYYGHGWAGADDVVGHEMTHGFIDQYSRLFYWGQSGAINESMADVIGEIIDHRHPSPGDAPNDWRLGEDSPVGTIRSLSDPVLYDQPDAMTSNLYTADDVTYSDEGGVHTNSGVGNKAAYLISQGGTFNGQTITGIDAGDPTLSKTAKLYVDVIERLSSGADYAALAQQLDQSCQDLRAAAGFTTADCTAVHQAGVATELTTTPTNAAQPADAPTTCPANYTKRVLFDSESGDAASKFTSSGDWIRTSDAGISNATSGTASWFAADPSTTQVYSLRTAESIALPAGQPTYLAFQGWNLLEYEPGTYYDGGTVEVAVNGNTPVSVASRPWYNGPTHALTSPNSGRLAFAGDSLGWVGSRVDLTAYAGSAIQPQFTMRSDSSVGYIGWYLDDITVYTCDGPPPPPPPPPPPSAVEGLSAAGFLRGMTINWRPPASNPQSVAGYEVALSPCLLRQTVSASTTSLRLDTGGKGCGATIEVYVRTTGLPHQTPPVASIAVQVGMVAVSSRRSGRRLTFKGAVFLFDRQRVPGGLVAIQRKSSSGWVTVRTVRTQSNGLFTASYRHRKRAYYRAAYLGGPNLIGSTTARHLA